MDCLFCKIAAGEIPGDIVHTTERTVAFRDLDAQAPTHVLIVPKDHYAIAAELAAGDPVASAELLTTAAAVATAEGWMDKLYPWKADIDVSRLPAGDYTFVAMTDDPSGGEGLGPFTDTRTIIVE